MNNVRKIRMLKGLTQYKLGKAIGKYQSLIWMIENGYYRPKEWHKETIAKVLGVEVVDIFPYTQ